MRRTLPRESAARVWRLARLVGRVTLRSPWAHPRNTECCASLSAEATDSDLVGTVQGTGDGEFLDNEMVSWTLGRFSQKGIIGTLDVPQPLVPCVTSLCSAERGLGLGRRLSHWCPWLSTQTSQKLSLAVLSADGRCPAGLGGLPPLCARPPTPVPPIAGVLPERPFPPGAAGTLQLDCFPPGASAPSRMT